MLDPIETEGRYQDLLLVLAHPSSPRQRLAAITEYIAGLGHQLPAAEPYVLDLAQRVPEIVRRFEPEGISPAELGIAYTTLAALTQQFPVLHSVRGFDGSLEILKRDLALQLTYVGNIQQAISIWGFEPLQLDRSDDKKLTPLQLLEEALQTAKAAKHPAVSFLADLMTSWRGKLREEPNRTIFPVVERLLTNPERQPKGRLRGTSLELFGPTMTDHDEIRIDVAILENGKREFLAPTLTAVRGLIRETHSSIAKRYLSGRIQFDDQTALHEGTSANLALGSLLYCEMLRYNNQRSLFYLSPRAALTGDLSGEGIVCPIENSTLAAKVEAVFYSWLECLAVPKEHVQAAEEVVATLNQQYPARRLHIIGVHHLRDVFYDRRLTEAENIGAITHIAKTAWRKKYSVGALAGYVLLFVVIAKLMYGPIDRNPVKSQFVDGVLRIQNEHGVTLEEQRIGADVKQDDKPENRYVGFWDLDGDGNNEVFYARKGADIDAFQDTIYCKSIGKGSPLWRTGLRHGFMVPGEPNPQVTHFAVHKLLVGDFDNNGRPEVIVLAAHPFNRCWVGKFDAFDGSELQSYFHAGHFSSMDAVDLDGDGMKEIVLAGTNAERRTACLVALDPRLIKCRSTINGFPVIQNGEYGVERCYVSIPRTIVGKVFWYDAKYSQAKVDAFASSGRLITVWINDVHSQYGNVDVSFYVFFSFDFIAADHGTSDAWDLKAEELYDKKRIHRKPDAEYWKEYLRTMLYWNGSRWVTTPTMNRLYADTVQIINSLHR